MVGLVMVASASAVDAFKQTSNAGSTFFRQGGFAVVGLILMLIASNMPMAFYRRLSMTFLLITLGLQVATVLFGKEINGNRNWLDLGFTSIQPSEFLKLGLIVGLGYQLSMLGEYADENTAVWKRVFVYSLGAVGLVAVLGKDMGTGIVMVVMLLGLYLFNGMTLKNWLSIIAVGAVAGWILVTQSASRAVRFAAWLNPDAADPMGVNWQFEKGPWAQASGGLCGTGLGRATLKWSWIPEVENDFIFAIIGEELGLIGAFMVVLLFLALGLVLFATAKAQTDPFSRNIVVGVMLWVVMQAFINIGVVLGLLPVLGVPLPLISAGGSSLIATLGAIGVVLAVERDRVANLGRRK
jgi:cell division protein FtsW